LGDTHALTGPTVTRMGEGISNERPLSRDAPSAAPGTIRCDEWRTNGAKLRRKTLSLTLRQADWIQTQLEGDLYATESEYIRELVRRDMAEFEADRDRLRSAIRSALEPVVGPGRLEEATERVLASVASAMAP